MKNVKTTRQINYRLLELKFQRDVKALQKSCEHKQLTPWMEVHWAPGHSTGTSTRRCTRCRKEISKDYVVSRCVDCGNEMSPYCATCIECGHGNVEYWNIIEHNGKRIKAERLPNESEEKERDKKSHA